MAIYEAVAALMESSMADFDVAGVLRNRSGGTLPGVAPANAYPTSDGADVLIAGNADAVFARLCQAMGRPELADRRPRYATHVARGADGTRTRRHRRRVDRDPDGRRRAVDAARSRGARRPGVHRGRHAQRPAVPRPRRWSSGICRGSVSTRRCSVSSRSSRARPARSSTSARPSASTPRTTRECPQGQTPRTSSVGTLGRMEWTVHGERSVYESEWMNLSLVDVELPSGKRFEHHVLRMPCDAAGVVVDDPDRGVLLLWRHRFISDTWGWEVPGRAGRSRRDTRAVRGPRDVGGDGLAGGRADQAHVVPAAQRHVRRPLPPLRRVERDLRRRTVRSRRGRAHRVGAVAAAAATRSAPAASTTACRSPRSSGAPRSPLNLVLRYAGCTHTRRSITRIDGQNSSSKATSPATPIWYELTVRSKKFESSCTSCSSMKLNGFFEPNSMP